MDPVDNIIEELILKGAVEIVGIEPITGQPLYSFNPSIKEIMPKLYEQHITETNREIMGLWEKGFLNIDFMEDNPRVTLTEKAFNNSDILSLSLEDQYAISEIKRVLLK